VEAAAGPDPVIQWTEGDEAHSARWHSERAAPAPAGVVIGTGTGVLASVLARRGIKHVVATDQDPRALACARDNVQRLGLSKQAPVVQAELFPDGRAALVVCNPPWVPARPRPDGSQ